MLLGGAGSVWGGTGWYLVVLGQFGVVLVGTWYYMVLLGIKWYWVSKVLLCLYILKKAEIWSGVTDPSQTQTTVT